MQKPHVLIVDDDQNIRSFLFNVLDRSGYRVSAAADGVEGLELFRRDPPEVTLTDLRMPHKDGREFVTEAIAEDPDAVFIVLTGHGTVDEAVELMRIGVYSVVSKPVCIDDILFMTEKALRERRGKERGRELEKRLEISERLAMIGKLAAGVAHELNSPLDGVIRFVKLTMECLKESSEAYDFQSEALSGLKRMSAIVKDLLTFSRNIALEVEEESLQALIREAATQAERSAPEKRVRITYDLALPDTKVPRGMFQVFANLLKNAVDAVETDGTVEIRAGARDGEIFVSVKDDGCGIPPDAKARVFEPFVTTKEVGKGTGLGLSIVSRIMQRFGGGVTLDSVEGKGSEVTVYLPSGTSTTRETADEEPVETTTRYTPAGR